MKRLLLTALTLVAMSSGCNRADGDRLARVGRKVTDKIQAVVPERMPFGSSIASSNNGGIEDRVRERFRTDVFLAPIQFEIGAEGGQVRLRGIVDDDVLRKRAIEIAESTVGVEKVVSEIVVQ